MADEATKDRFDTLTDRELEDHVVSGHVDPEAGETELARRRREAAKATAADSAGTGAGDAGKPAGDTGK